jgi:hypothetical protein
MGQKDLLLGVMLVRRLGRVGKWQWAENLTTFAERMAEYPLEENAALELVPAKTGREHCPDALRYSLSIRAWPDMEAELEEDRPRPMGDNIANKIPRLVVVSESVMGPLA